MVSSAVFSDLDSDGFPELILAIEWGPIRVFKNDKGKLREATTENGLDKFTGLWTSITTGDLDGDGKLDIIAGNWGHNSFYNRAGQGPWTLYHADFAQNNTIGLIEAYRDPALQMVVPFRDLDTLGAQYPALRSHFKTHEAFAKASMNDLLGPDASRTQSLAAQTLDSTIFWNLGRKFRTEPLPPSAQFAPVFGMNVADFNNDGIEDLFLAQNFFAMRGEDDRLDAGRGLLLKGNGNGKLAPLDGALSGLKIYGEQRGSAVSDFDADGRADLAVTQNGAQTKLYHNVTPGRGLRVRLKGPPGNPSGIGAILRVKTGSALGPAREIHGGSGYLSEDSVVQILHAPAESEISIVWPGGGTTTHKVPKDAREIRLDRSGGSARIR
jgi:enediyne biosynthesis protein E4